MNNFNSYENKDSNDNNNNKVRFGSKDNSGNNSNKNKDSTTSTINNNNINSNDNNNPRTSKQRNRNIVWFNPPFSKNVATKIGRYFLNLIDKDFPRDSKFHKIFNRSSIKVSYTSMLNAKLAIILHNRKNLHAPVNN